MIAELLIALVYAAAAHAVAELSRGVVHVRGDAFEYLRLEDGSYQLTRGEGAKRIVLHVRSIGGDLRVTRSSGPGRAPRNIRWLSFHVDAAGRLAVGLKPARAALVGTAVAS